MGRLSPNSMKTSRLSHPLYFRESPTLFM